ncbi:MAG: hypothetical protein AAF614_26195 [Chloroflexota bacterium]
MKKEGGETPITSSSRWVSLLNLLVITVLGLPLVTPLLHLTAVPCTHDGHLHYHRVAAMRYAWQNGLYFTRWLPDLAFGYGYPFFVYREPTPLYAVLFPHLAGLPLPAASNLFYALCILGAGYFMFLWVRDILGTTAAFVAAFAYMSAPYMLIDSLIRGNSPESLALPLFPFLLWAGRRWLLGGTAVSYLLATLGLAFLSLSHNISLLIFAPTLLVYLLAIGWLHRLNWQTVAVRLILFIGLGLGMTFFYSGGALLELDSVTLEQSTNTRNNDFRFNFATWGEILGPVPPEDPSNINPPLPFRLGWVPIGLAVIGLFVAIRDWRLEIGDSRKIANRQSPINQSPKEKNVHILLMLAGTAVFLFMSLPASRFLWDNLPLIDFVQFPWRFVGRAALPLAFLAGVPFTIYDLRAKRRVSTFTSTTSHVSRFTLHALRFAPLIAIALLFLETMPNLYPRYCEEESFPTINDVHEYERESGLVGVDPEGSYFPRTVKRRPLSSPLEPFYLEDSYPQRFDQTVLPADATLNSQDYEPRQATVRVSSPEPYTARYLSFAFAGWSAAVDGEPVAITPSDPEGLITFSVPAGDHELTIEWGSTPVRSVLVALSIMSLAGVAITAVVLSIEKTQLDLTSLRDLSGLKAPSVLPLLAVGIVLFVLKIGVLDRVENPLRRTSPPNVTTTTTLQAGELALNGFTLSQTSVASGGTFDIDMTWTAVSPPTATYQSNIWLEDTDGQLWSDKETHRTRLYETAPRTNHWRVGQWGWDSREVAVLPGTPPGVYNVILTQFDRDTLQPLTLIDTATGQTVGPTAVLGQITITLPDEPTALTPQFDLQASLPDQGLTLLGYNQDRSEAAPGDPFLLTLFWERTGENLAATLNLQLQNEAGQPLQEWALAPPANADSWPQGFPLRAQHSLRLPASLNSGSYRFVVADVALGELTINAPERIFEQPEVETAVNATFLSPDNQQLITLVGYTTPNLQSPITLLWQANTETPTSYRIFIHLVDANGQIFAQADGEPAGWTRPTTGWAAGEFVLDTHQLALPENLPDNLELRVGLYDPATGQRLQTETADFVTIPLSTP